MEDKKKERTIRSETTKVFLVIFVMLVVVGIFTIGASIIGSNNFDKIRDVHLKQFRAAEVMKQRALDVIAIYYLLATDQDQDILMRELKRYDGLVESFEQARNSMIAIYKDSDAEEKTKIIAYLIETKQIFDELNNACRRMTFAMMGGDKKASAAEFPSIDAGIRKFKTSLDRVEKVVEEQLDKEADLAQWAFKHITRLGITIIVLAIFITLGLIYYLMKFLSISLLPISNLMHNMRQAVFSVDKNLKVISPVSAYSSIVFGEDIVGKNLNDIAYSELDKNEESYGRNKVALDVVFGGDEIQWMLQEDGLIRQVKRNIESTEKTLKLTYTPLYEKETVKNIMIVAEDVTEVESLKALSEAKQRDLEIIKAVIEVDSSDLEEFLLTARTQIIECRALIERIDSDLEARALMLRLLHTLKGNARMYDLSSISEVVHETESEVIRISGEIEDFLNPDQIIAICKVFDNVDDILALHSKMARRFFGIKDLYSDRAEEQLKNAVARIELAIDQKAANKMNKALFENAIKAALYFEKSPLVFVLSKLKEGEVDPSIKADISEEYLKLLLDNGGIRPFALDSSRWISVFHGIIELTLEWKNNQKSFRIMQLARELSSLAEAENLSFIRQKILVMLENKEETQSAISSLWSFMSGVCAFESSLIAESEQIQILRSNLAKNDNADDVFLRSRLLALSLVRSLERKNINIGEFWEMALWNLSLKDKSSAINAFIGMPAHKEKMQVVTKLLKTGRVQDFEKVKAEMGEELPIKLLLNENHSSQLQLDIMRLFITFTKDESAVFENEEQTLEISASRFLEIKKLVTGLAASSFEEAQINIALLNSCVEHAFDYSLRTVCKKMEPMVYDLSKRMGKDIYFSISGENVAVDRNSAHAIRDALVHIIRNCLDHGIETPEERVSKGKKPKALLEIKIQKNGDMVEIAVRDDGRGINADKLVKKAVAMGSISESETLNLSHEERLHLMFIPNLSTKEDVSAISGRGVGMDAVKSTIDKLGGKISVASSLNAGSEFTISFPD